MSKNKKDTLTIIGVVLLAMLLMCVSCSPSSKCKGMYMENNHRVHYHIAGCVEQK